MNEWMQVYVYLLREKEKDKNVKIFTKLLDMIISKGMTIVGEEEALTFCYINLYMNEITWMVSK